ncbi:hypothetical protein SAMN04487947_4039 [Halogeometricum rufum]|uniref:Glycosyltransferase 2-like domain-containing protein n=1 Tax=Halogeometricum rufum TaxID=553469 RepID=A0A1I6J4I3_9EURY|nr:flippase-like domain-containing protein [Halogeometricum rufum]SFR73924.1 hypothetical protein SAMN04487947_4039 [Halogeometricum rufum]
MIVDVIIPAYNEADHFRQLEERLLEPLRSVDRDWEFRVYLVVNDDSTDESPELADELAERCEEVRVVHRTVDPGFGNALKHGFVESDGDVVVPFMADYSDDPFDIPKLVDEIENGYDFVYGSRFAPGGTVEGYSPLKLFYNRSFNNLVRLLFGVRERDITNAFSAYRRTVISSIGPENIDSESFDITAELPLRAHIKGFRSTEVPVSWRSREAGVSKLNATRKGPLYVKRLLEQFVVGNAAAMRDLTESVTSQSKSRLLSSVVFGIVILLVLLSISGMNSVFDILRNANPAWIAVAAAAYLGSFVIRTWRWRVLLRTSGHLASRGGVFRSILAGWFINFLVPARGGDILRGLALKTTEDVPFSVGTGTIVIARIFDMLVLALGLFAVSLLFVDSRYTIYLGVGAVGLAAVMLAGLGAVYYFGDWVSDRFEHWIADIRESIRAVREALQESATNPFGLSLAFLLSIPVWVLEASTLFFTARALSLSIPPAPVVAAGIAAFVSQAVPVTPAGIGTFEATITAVLSLSGVEQNVGTSLSILDHFMRLAVVYLFGAVSVVHIGFRSRTYFRKKRRESNTSPVE